MSIDWSRVEQLFQRACHLPPSERRACLSEACQGDDALRQEVESLLKADGGTQALEDIVSRAVLEGDAGEGPVETTEQHWIGNTCGAWRLVELIGSGGMGAVFLAERADEEYRQRAAVKLLHDTLSDHARLEGFHRERQALATLEHPHIARLIDGGSSAGRPYLVMEYVEGKPIDQWCDLGRRSTRERLELFCKVCEALHHAHLHLVVHLDVKPKNILVTSEGTPKVLDFGIARFLRDRDSETVPTHQAMTPVYASPEQIQGRPLTVQSDVYSLGVLLYQLLTGQNPFEGGTRAVHELARRICEDPPPPPSSAVRGRRGEEQRVEAEQRARLRSTTPERLRRQLAGDLDTIVLMALRKEPHRRYASAEQLASDIRRHLDGLPVIARPDTATYRSSKFIRRHRIGMAAAALVGLTLIAAVLGQRRSLARERDLVDGMQVNLSAMFEVIDWGKEAALIEVGMSEIPPRLLEQNPGLARLLDILPRAEEAATRAVYRVPTEQIDYLDQIAEGYAQLNRSEDARRVREHALELIRSLPDPDSLREARALQRLGRAREALEIREEILDAPHPDIAESLHSLGRKYYDRGEFDQAKALYARARAMRREVVSGPDPVMVGWTQSLAGFLHRTDRNEEALDAASAAVRMARETDDQNLVASALGTRGWLNQDAHRYEEALGDLQDARTILERTLSPRHQQLIVSAHALALVYKDMGCFDEARAWLEEATASSELNYGADSVVLSDECYSMARLLADEGRWSEAEPWCRRAVELIIRRYPEPRAERGDGLTTLGRILVRQGKVGEARPYLEEALELRRRLLHPGFWEVHKTASILGEALVLLGECEQAWLLLKDSVPEIAADRGEHHHRTAQAWRRLVVWAEACGEPEQVELYRARITNTARLSPIVQATVP